jgi:transcriptional regulator with XRE-family HTH domain
MAQHVQLRRKEFDLSQEELAEGAGLSPSTVGKVERGEINCKLSTLNALSKLLGTKAAYLLMEVEERDLAWAIAIEEGRLEWLVMKVRQSGKEALRKKLLKLLAHYAKILGEEGERDWKIKELKGKETAQRILIEVEAKGGRLTLTARKMGERIGRSRSTTWENLSWLLENHLIRRIKRQTGRGKGNTWGLTLEGKRVIKEMLGREGKAGK